MGFTVVAKTAGGSDRPLENPNLFLSDRGQLPLGVKNQKWTHPKRSHFTVVTRGHRNLSKTPARLGPLILC